MRTHVRALKLMREVQMAGAIDIPVDRFTL
jgi:hypothetical protein